MYLFEHLYSNTNLNNLSNVRPREYNEMGGAQVTDGCEIHYSSLYLYLFRVQSYSLEWEYQNSLQIFVTANSGAVINSSF